MLRFGTIPSCECASQLDLHGAEQERFMRRDLEQPVWKGSERKVSYDGAGVSRSELFSPVGRLPLQLFAKTYALTLTMANGDWFRVSSWGSEKFPIYRDIPDDCGLVIFHANKMQFPIFAKL